MPPGPVYQSGACTADFCLSLMQHQKEDQPPRVAPMVWPRHRSRGMCVIRCLARRKPLQRSTLTRLRSPQEVDKDVRTEKNKETNFSNA